MMGLDNFNELTVYVINHPEAVVTTILALLGGRVILQWIKQYFRSKALAIKRKNKQMECQKALEELRAHLARNPVTNESEILSLSLTELLNKLRSKELKPSQVLAAYQAQALRSHEQTNCLVEPIREAEEMALALDSSDPGGRPLFGLPVSMKDNFGFEGYDSTIGCANWIDKPFDQDAALVSVLKEQGAVPFVKTNIPQTMISWETTNPIFGPTCNKYDKTRGVGGSSGGEGALVSCGGSLLGFGSDIGGSIRIPANMSGVCGMKPTAGRISTKGTHPIMKGQNVVQACYGPLAADVESLVVAMRAVLVPAMWHLDPSVIDVPFREEVFTQKRRLKIGFYTYDGYFHAAPVMERAVLEAKATLEKIGHQIVPWEYPNLGLTAAQLWAKCILGDGGQELKEILENDTTDSAIGKIMLLLKAPYYLKKILLSIVKPLMPNMAVPFESAISIRSVTDWWKAVSDVQAFRQEVMTDWKKKGLDAVIAPGFASVACPLDAPSMMSGAGSYTFLYNVLNFPAGSLPVTTVTKEDESKAANYPTPDLWHKVHKKTMVGSTGLPANVQVVTLPYQDELCLSVMAELEQALKK